VNSFAYIKVRDVDWTQLIACLGLTFPTLTSLLHAFIGSLKLHGGLCYIPQVYVGSCFWEPVEVKKWRWIKALTTGWERILSSLFHYTTQGICFREIKALIFG
jgi:hypothetical protein